MMLRGLTEDQVHRAVEQAGVALRRRPVRRGDSWSLTIRARSREDRARGYRDLCARIFEANPRAAIAPCFLGDLLLYPVGLEEEPVTPADSVPVGVSADRWAEFNRKFCALLHRGTSEVE